MSRTPQLATAALFVGRANAALLLGMTWAATRRAARALGVPELRVSERVVLIDAQALLAALRQRAEREQAALSPEGELEQALRSMGLERRA